MRLLGLALAALLVAPAIAAADPLRGVVIDDSGAPVAGAQVLVAGQEVATDERGRFVIPDGPVTADDVVVTALGFEPLLDRVLPGREARLRLTRAPDGVTVEEIVLEADAPFVTAPPAYDLGPDVVTTVAGAGNDALKALQSLPGVARIPFGLGGLVLRGKSPRSSNVFLDGVEVPLLYHFGGLASFLPTPMIDGMDLMPGSYGVRWGRGLGGVVDLRSRAPRRDRWRVGSEVSLLDAQVRGEGPLAGGGVLLGLRRSYVDAVLAAAAPDLTLAPRYVDGQLRWDRGNASERGGRWSALVFGSDDLLTFVNAGDTPMEDGTDLRYRSRFLGAALTWRRDDGPWSTTVTPSIGADEVSLRVDGEGITRQNVPLALRAETARRWSDARIAAGVDVVGTRHRFDVANEPPPRPGAPASEGTVRRAGTRWAADAGAWVEGFRQLAGGRLGVTPGLRLDRLGLTDEWVLDPRLALSSELPDGVVATAAIGRYHEPPSFADVDPAFGNQALRASSSIQASVAVRVPLPESLSVDVTAFYDRSRGLPVDAVTSASAQATGGLQGGGVGAASRELTDEQFGSYSYRENDGLGRAGGVELLVRKRAGAWTGWLAYTYSRAMRRGHPDVDPVWRPYVLDQPHLLTALASVPLGRWQLGARVRVASGNPITPVASAYYDASADEYVAVDGALLGERLPAFVQLDVRVDRTWVRPWGTTKLFLDLQNATNRLNPEGVSYSEDYSRRAYTRGLPIFPSIGVEYQP